MPTRGVNKVILIGNIGRDPELKEFANGGKVATLSLCTSETWLDKETKEKMERAEWHNVVFRDKMAEIIDKYVRKGDRLYVEGSLRTRKWKDSQGNDRYTTEIIAHEMQMLTQRERAGADTPRNDQYTTRGAPTQTPDRNPPPKAMSGAEAHRSDPDDDIPFNF